PGPAARGTPQTAPTTVATNGYPTTVATNGYPTTVATNGYPTTVATNGNRASDLARSDGASGPLARIAFVRGGDVYVLDTAAAVEGRVTRDGQSHSHNPSWTADGQALLFERQTGDQHEVWLWRRGLAQTVIQSGVWSADGKKDGSGANCVQTACQSS